MANYHYSSVDGADFKYNGLVTDIPVDNHEYEGSSFGESTLYYSTEAGKVTDIIAESELSQAFSQKTIFETFDFVRTIA